MRRQFLLILLSVLVGVIALHRSNTFNGSKLQITGIQEENDGKIKREAITHYYANQPSKRVNVIENSEKSKPEQNKPFWEAYTPLSSAEAEAFKKVQEEISRFYAWGEMSPDQIDSFRETMFRLGERGVAQLARELNDLDSGSIEGESVARQQVEKLDSLLYLASNGAPKAKTAVEELAKRPIIVAENGEIQSALRSYVTFEAFQILSSIDADQAKGWIEEGASERLKKMYIYHYATGRRLAGVKDKDIERDVGQVFGEELVPAIYPKA